MSDHVLGEFPAIEAIAAIVGTTPERVRQIATRHDCPGLNRCINHPKWHVVHDRFFIGSWMACPPGDELPTHFPTHTAAINYAQKEATK